MRDQNHRTLIAPDIVFKPLNTVGIKMVGRFIENKPVTRHNKRMSQGNPLALTTGKRTHHGRKIVQPELAKHCLGV